MPKKMIIKSAHTLVCSKNIIQYIKVKQATPLIKLIGNDILLWFFNRGNNIKLRKQIAKTMAAHVEGMHITCIYTFPAITSPTRMALVMVNCLGLLR